MRKWHPYLIYVVSITHKTDTEKLITYDFLLLFQLPTILHPNFFLFFSRFSLLSANSFTIQTFTIQCLTCTIWFMRWSASFSVFFRAPSRDGTIVVIVRDTMFRLCSSSAANSPVPTKVKMDMTWCSRCSWKGETMWD